MHKNKKYIGLSINEAYVEEIEKNNEELTEKLKLADDYIKELREKLGAYENPKNWTRGYDWHGKLINEHAVYRPKLKHT